MRKNSKKGQVAVEFVLMFVLVIAVIIYAFFFASSLTAVHYRSYETFMIGRSVLASSKDYITKAQRAGMVKDAYEHADATKMITTTDFNCTIDASNGFRHIMNYGYPTAFNVYSDAGIACSFSADYLLPGLVTKDSSNKLQLASESMTGSEMSEDHCDCALDPAKTWSDCLKATSQGQQTKVYIKDNGC